MQGGFIEPEDPRWSEVLAELPHDFYHLPGYTRFSARRAGGRACAFWGEHAGATLFIPLVLRALPRDLATHPAWQDAMSPYGYASPLTTSGQSLQAETELWLAFRRLCQEHSIVAVFLRFHPLLASSSACAEIGRVVEEGATVFIDLSASTDEIFLQIRENHRRGIRRLRNAGFQTVIDDWDGFDEFAALYRETMQRAGATREYFFDDDYFRELVGLNEANIHFCKIMAPGGAMAAAGLFFCCGDIAQFHLSATAEAYVEQSPTKLMFDDMSRWAKERGCSFLHLGGGVGCRNDSLFNFKAGFSNCRATYRSLRIVCQEDSYALLAGRAAGDATCGSSGGFFPAYRQTRFS